MRFLFCLTVSLALSPAIGWAQDACVLQVTGVVTNELGAPLSQAVVRVQEISKGTITDASGNFAIDKLCSGEYVLEVRYVGYAPTFVSVTAGNPKPYGIQLQPESQNLEEVVIHDKLEKVNRSANFVILEGETLEKSAGKTLGESLKAMPGVNTVQTGPGIFKPVIHGVHSQRVLILNHGIRQEGQQWGAEHAPEIDPFTASNIIVVKDAAAIRYGTDALGGVIVVNPADLPTKPGLGGSLNLVGQTNGRSGIISGMLEGGLKKWQGFGWRVQGTAKRTGDYHAPDYSLTNTGVREFDFSASAGYHREKFGVEAFYSHFQTALGILKGSATSNLDDLIRATETEPPIGTTDFSYSIGPPRQEVSHNLLKLNSHVQGARGEWHLQYGYQSNFRKEFDNRPGDLSAIPAIDLKLTTHTVELEYEMKENSGLQLTFGANGMYQNNVNIPGTKRVPFIPNFASVNGGPFAVGKLTLDQWTVDLGARYDVRSFSVAGYDFSNTLYKADLLFQNASVTAGFSRSISGRNQLKFNVSSAWRPPHVAELYSLGTHQSAAAIEYGLLLNDSTNQVLDISKVPFKLERALKGVLTYQHLAGRFMFEATGYANMIYNYIYLQPRGVTTNVRGTYPYFRYTQTDALFVGLDAEVEYTLSETFSLVSKISLLSATDIRNDDYLVFIPSNRLELSARYHAPISKFYVEPKISMVAKQTRAPRVITVRQFRDAIAAGNDPLGGTTDNFDFMEAPPGYALASIATGYAWMFGDRRLDARISVENLLNTSYREYTNRLRYYADDIGRNISVSLKYSF